MRQTIAALALVLPLTLSGCTSEEEPTNTNPAPQTAATTRPAPTRQEAREIIANSAELGQHEFTDAAVSLPIAGSSMSAPARDEARQLAAGGWISIDGAGDIMLTDKSRSDKRFLLRPNGLLDVVPLAKKEMGEVTDVSTNDDGTVRVDFTWRWIPNEVGSAFTSGAVHERYTATHNASATLMWNGSEWTMISITPR
jgi:hypothetical protein